MCFGFDFGLVNLMICGQILTIVIVLRYGSLVRWVWQIILYLAFNLDLDLIRLCILIEFEFCYFGLFFVLLYWFTSALCVSSTCDFACFYVGVCVLFVDFVICCNECWWKRCLCFDCFNWNWFTFVDCCLLCFYVVAMLDLGCLIGVV